MSAHDRAATFASAVRRGVPATGAPCDRPERDARARALPRAMSKEHA